VMTHATARVSQSLALVRSNNRKTGGVGGVAIWQPSRQERADDRGANGVGAACDLRETPRASRDPSAADDVPQHEERRRSDSKCIRDVQRPRAAAAGVPDDQRQSDRVRSVDQLVALLNEP